MDAIQQSGYYVFIEEIAILATLIRQRITVHFSEAIGIKEFVPSDEDDANVCAQMWPWANSGEVVHIYLQGLHFSKYIFGLKGEADCLLLMDFFHILSVHPEMFSGSNKIEVHEMGQQSDVFKSILQRIENDKLRKELAHLAINLERIKNKLVQAGKNPENEEKYKIKKAKYDACEEKLTHKNFKQILQQRTRETHPSNSVDDSQDIHNESKGPKNN